MAVTRDQLIVGGRAFWKMTLSKPGTQAEIKMIPVRVLSVERAAARVQSLEEGGYTTPCTIKFSNLEPDLEYLSALEADKAERVEAGGTKRPRGRPRKTSPEVLHVANHYVRPAAHANAQDLAAAVAEERERYVYRELPPISQPHLTIVREPEPELEALEEPSEEESKPNAGDPIDEEIATLLEMRQMLFAGIDKEIATCEAEREELHAKRRELETALEANAERKRTLQAKRARMRAFLEQD